MNKLVIDNPTYGFIRKVIWSLPWSPTHSLFVFESSSPTIIPHEALEAIDREARDKILKKFVIKEHQTKEEIEAARNLQAIKEAISRKFIIDSKGDYTNSNSKARKDLVSVVTNELNIEITDPAQFERVMRVRLNLESNRLYKLKEDNYQLHRPGETNELDNLVEAGYILLEPGSGGSLFDDFIKRGYILRSGRIGPGYGGNSEHVSLNFRALGGNKPKHMTLSFDSSGDRDEYEKTREWFASKAADEKLGIYERDMSKRQNSV